MSGVRLEGIAKGYGEETAVLSDISIEVAAGEFLTLLGASGCGKSTLLRIIAGLEHQDAGTVHIQGRNVDDVPPSQRDIAMVFQSHALYPHMTARQNIALPLRMRRLSTHQRLPLIGSLLPAARAAAREIDRDVERTAALCKVEHLLERKPDQLSGGQRQRVALSRAMVRSPAVFLLDEPLSSLDAALRVSLRAEIKQLHRRLGATFIYVTHDHIEAMTMSDRIAVMLQGRLRQIGAPREVYADPDCLAVAELLGAPKINVVDGSVTAHGELRVGNRVLASCAPLDAGTRVKVGIRPECIEVDSPARGGLVGRIEWIEDHGGDRYVYAGVEGLEKPLVARLAASRHLGDIIRLSVAPERLLCFDEQGERLRVPLGGIVGAAGKNTA